MIEKVMTENGFRARDIGLRAQKKILSRMATKSIAKSFIDDTTASLLDNVYRLAKLHSGNKKEAEKLVKNIIKVVIKISILYRNNQFSNDELKLAERFRQKFQTTQMAVISFYEVDFSFDLPYLKKSFKESQDVLKKLVERHLTDKTLQRIDDVFAFVSDDRLLEQSFRRDTQHYELMGKIVADLNAAMDNGNV